ncbi:hypothetical protein FEM48_Zijuj06G0100300 [Ziziphus jujuba var. spinosa]|uniref:Uncharacterized protein n=1 Tax=Ziziphus jujuba var. spinosa TaxID=714518 RepID=A0A978V8M4_ZIZJJ|nr:hypothetical protein FEM48_Zijuj06G0100300 [Ziziphus jujuba var. spinosa]
MTKLGDQSACVISDSFLGWTNASCRRFGIPRLTFHGMGAFAMAVKKSLSIYQTHREGVDSDSTIRNVEGVQLPFVLTMAFCIGPLFLLHGQILKEPNPFPTWANWLNQQVKSKSTIFVSFGSQANLSPEQLEELGYGLELSGRNYMWVVRKKDWDPPSTNCGLVDDPKV